ncbi:hypothetical protein M9H77_11122 [Catharanthus roseus]|uniref:Uncharacterized protein n=1 Tax=Catharanthus roseus TaxID=4058 RepID=A0ACC0BDR6_CATRO|nr:hypothetical protein M9H77_11122 [Catharanthus roseus]
MPVEQKFVQGIHCFWLSVLPILLAVLDKVTGLRRRFLWVGHQPRIAWKTLCLPKQDGGLGLRDGRAWNFALLAKKSRNSTLHYEHILRPRSITLVYCDPECTSGNESDAGEKDFPSSYRLESLIIWFLDPMTAETDSRLLNYITNNQIPTQILPRKNCIKTKKPEYTCVHLTTNEDS